MDNDTAALENKKLLLEQYKAYTAYSSAFKNRFKWLPSTLFIKALANDLLADALALLDVLKQCGDWNPDHDAKLAELVKLATQSHGKEKLLVFTQFADTARYLKSQLTSRGVKQIEEATGESADPTHLAWRFSPESNGKRNFISPRPTGEGPGERGELRILIATDVLSEGQNLQDAHIIVNYDLPWAIIRLIQREGRVDRIGQPAAQVRHWRPPAGGLDSVLAGRRPPLRHRRTGKPARPQADLLDGTGIIYRNLKGEIS